MTWLSDVAIINVGTLVKIQVNSDRAMAWIRENVDYDPCLWWGNVLHVEHRYAGEIIHAMVAEGLKVRGK